MDYEKVTKLVLIDHRATDVKGLEKLAQLKELWLHNNKLTDVEGLRGFCARLEYLWLSNNLDLTKAQIDALQKALPNCKIYSDH